MLFVDDLYNGNQLLNWQDFRAKFGLRNNDHFMWIQIINAIPITWRRLVENSQITSRPLRVQHTLMLTRQIPLETLTSKYIYTLKIMKIKEPPTSQVYIINKIQEDDLDWTSIYTNGRRCTIDNYTRNFHFRCSHNILFLNKWLFRANLTSSSLCPFCKIEDEDIIHLFANCIFTKNLWTTLGLKICPQLPPLTPKSAFFGYPENNSKLINHIHLIFRIAVYNSRSESTCNVQYILNKINNTKKIEENLSFSNQNSRDKYNEKWSNYKILPTIDE